MSNAHEPLPVNIIGHAAGALIFGIFLFLFFQDRSGTRLRGSWRSATAAGLALLWNIGSLAVLAFSGAPSSRLELLADISFSALSLLPAVLFDLSLEQRLRPLVTAGYTLSVCAMLLHSSEFFSAAHDYHRLALILITAGFGLLTAFAAVAMAVTKGRQLVAPSRLLGTMCLCLFAVSFVHFGAKSASTAWTSELVFHHAGIPLALFVLLQDYRFILLDAFVRFLTNVLLAGVIITVGARAGQSFVSMERFVSDPIYQTAVLFLASLLLILFAFLRRNVEDLLTRFVFRQNSAEVYVKALRHPAASESEIEYLSYAAQQVADFLGTARFQVSAQASLTAHLDHRELRFPVPSQDLPLIRGDSAWDWVEAVVPLRPSGGDVFYFLLGRRAGGRRYLSGDLQSLARFASTITEDLDRFRSVEMQRLMSQAELRALQAQINPHFLFNALNTLYGLIPRQADGARRMVLNLAEIFRYFLQTERTFIPLSQELQIVKAYLEIEKLRLGARLQTEIDVDGEALSAMIPVLSIEPLVENAVKHGVAASSETGWVRLRAKVSEDALTITVEDTGPGMKPGDTTRRTDGSGVGLANVTRRLRLCYGPHSDLHIASNGNGTTVQFSVPLAAVQRR